MADAVREIIQNGEDIRGGWSDPRVVEEASPRVAATTSSTAPTRTDMMRWLTEVAEIRSEADNDGQARVPRRHDDPPTP